VNVKRDPRHLDKGLRQACFSALGRAIGAVKDEEVCSVETGGINAVDGFIFWATRVRTHLAPGLGCVQEELAFDPNSAHFLYDVRQVCSAPSSPSPSTGRAH